MSPDLLVAIELLLVFGLAFAWGLNELRQLRRYKNSQRDIPKAGKSDRQI